MSTLAERAKAMQEKRAAKGGSTPTRGGGAGALAVGEKDRAGGAAAATYARYLLLVLPPVLPVIAARTRDRVRTRPSVTPRSAPSPCCPSSCALELATVQQYAVERAEQRRCFGSLRCVRLGQAWSGTHAEQGRRGSESKAGGTARQVAHAAHTALHNRSAAPAARARARARARAQA